MVFFSSLQAKLAIANSIIIPRKNEVLTDKVVITMGYLWLAKVYHRFEIILWFFYISNWFALLLLIQSSINISDK